MGYDSKQDVSPELELDAASYFQTVIGIFEWMTALGKINILDELLLFEMRFYHQIVSLRIFWELAGVKNVFR